MISVDVTKETQTGRVETNLEPSFYPSTLSMWQSLKTGACMCKSLLPKGAPSTPVSHLC